MQHLKKMFVSAEACALSFLILFSISALAQDVVSPGQFLDQVLAFIQSWGGLAQLMKVSGVILLLIASMKVSILNQYVWAKLGSMQAWLAPLLGLVAGVLGLGQNGPITLASVFAYISAGAGAVVLHELLDTLKAVPGLGGLWVMVINLIENALGGPNSLLLKKGEKK